MKPGRVRVLVLAAIVVASLPLALGLSTEDAQQAGNNLDLDIAYQDTNNNLEYVDSSGNNADTGVDASRVGGMGDSEMTVNDYLYQYHVVQWCRVWSHITGGFETL